MLNKKDNLEDIIKEKLLDYINADKNTSADEKRDLLDNIKEIRQLLSKRAEEIELEYKTKLQEEIYAERCKTIGKCYRLKKFAKSVSCPEIIAFKILDVTDNQNSSFARCLTICNGSKNAWTEIALSNRVVGIWAPDVPTMIPSSNDKLLINLFEEISDQEFEELKNEIFEKLENK